MISDFASPSTEQNHHQSLGQLHENLKVILSSLTLEHSPKISVIIPTFNRNVMLKRAIESVTQQSSPAHEIIVIDDKSTDKTRSMLEKTKNIITFYQNMNRGVSAARNRGINLSTGDWICFLDSDDVWKKDKLELQINYLSQTPWLRIIQSNETWIRNGQKLTQKKISSKADWLGLGTQFREMLSISLFRTYTQVTF